MGHAGDCGPEDAQFRTSHTERTTFFGHFCECLINLHQHFSILAESYNLEPPLSVNLNKRPQIPFHICAASNDTIYCIKRRTRKPKSQKTFFWFSQKSFLVLQKKNTGRLENSSLGERRESPEASLHHVITIFISSGIIHANTLCPKFSPDSFGAILWLLFSPSWWTSSN